MRKLRKENGGTFFNDNLEMTRVSSCLSFWFSGMVCHSERTIEHDRDDSG